MSSRGHSYGRPCAVVQPRFQDFAPGLEKGAWWSCRGSLVSSGSAPDVGHRWLPGAGAFQAGAKPPEPGVHVRLCSPGSRILPLAWKRRVMELQGQFGVFRQCAECRGTDDSLAQELSRPEQNPGTGRPCVVVQPRFQDFAPGLEKGAWWICRGSLVSSGSAPDVGHRWLPGAGAFQAGATPRNRASMCGCAAPLPGFCSWPGKRRVVELQGSLVSSGSAPDVGHRWLPGAGAFQAGAKPWKWSSRLQRNE